MKLGALLWLPPEVHACLPTRMRHTSDKTELKCWQIGSWKLIRGDLGFFFIRGFIFFLINLYRNLNLLLHLHPAIFLFISVIDFGSAKKFVYQVSYPTWEIEPVPFPSKASSN